MIKKDEIKHFLKGLIRVILRIFLNLSTFNKNVNLEL
jgi:hypothetical protein